MNDKKLYAFFFAFLVLFSLTVGVAVFRNPIRNITRAGQDIVDIRKSVLLADKLEALAGKDMVSVTVFVRNSESRSLENKPVTLSASLGSLDVSRSLTDRYGRSVFRLTSKVPGEVVLTGTIDGVQITQPLTVKFLANSTN